MTEANDTQPPRSWAEFLRKRQPERPIGVAVPMPEPGSGTPYGRAALTSEAAELASTEQGHRNDQLNIAAFKLAQLVAAGHLNQADVDNVLRVAASAAGLPLTEIEATLRSGTRAGLEQPRQVPELTTGGTVTETTPDDIGAAEASGEGQRRLTLTRASDITIKPVHWLWAERVPLGTLALIGGREGIGKSIAAYTLAADVTQGRLPGKYFGQAKAVIVAATEDSWSRTIVPRLMGAEADLDLVYRVDVTTSDGVGTGLSMPRDLHALAKVITEVGAVLILLDPLMSRLDAALDSHKDAEVRRALEPLTALCEQCGTAALGLIHVNKSSTSDPLTALMGSRAFAAVARAVLFFMTDPDDEETRLLGQPKNNLGRLDLPTLTFRIVSAVVETTAEGEEITTGKLVWGEERVQTIREALESANESADVRSAADEAMGWLEDHLTSQGGTDDSATIKVKGGKAGHSVDALKRARKRLKAPITSHGFPRRTYWSLPGTQSEQTVGADSRSKSGESAPTAPTALTGPVGAVSAVSAVGARPPAHAREARPAALASHCRDCGTALDNQTQQARGTCGPCYFKAES